MAVLLTPPSMQFLDDSGNPLAAGKVYSYEAGTSTPKDTYTDSGGLTAHANPVILDSAGRPPGDSIWLSGSYKFTITDSDDVEVSTVDNITAFNAGVDATDSVKGIASFSSDNFLVSSGHVTIKDKGVAVAELADGTDGELITWDNAGEATTVAAGNDGQVLTSNGAGNEPAFEDAYGAYYLDTGTGSGTFVITPDPAISAYAAGQKYTIKLANGSSSSGNTLEVSGIGTANLKKANSLSLGESDLAAGMIITVVHDGTDFIVTSAIKSPAMYLPFKQSLGTSYTVTKSDGVIEQSGTGTKNVNLLAGGADTYGKLLLIVDRDGSAVSHNIVINPNGTDKIDGVNSSITLNTAYAKALLYGTRDGDWIRLI